eukprot:13167651-Ditylum_brightwellii.AAC.1
MVHSREHHFKPLFYLSYIPGSTKRFYKLLFCKLHFLLVIHAKANKKQHKDHVHCTKRRRYEKYIKFLFPLCTNPNDAFEEVKEDKNKKMSQNKKGWEPNKSTKRVDYLVVETRTWAHSGLHLAAPARVHKLYCVGHFSF